MLDKKTIQGIQRNHEVAEILSNMGLVATATKLDACHRVQVSNSLPEFLSEEYCNRTLLCWHCSRVKSMKRADQIMEACRRFSERIASNRLMSHRFIIAPFMQDTTVSPEVNLLRALTLLMEFRSEIYREHHRRRSRTTWGGYVETNNDKLKLWGPTVNAIHLVPKYASRNNVEPFVHMHLTVTTAVRASKKDVTATIANLFNTAKANCRIVQLSTREEIIRESKYVKFKHRVCKDDIDDAYAGREVPAGSRFGEFNPHENRSCELFNRTLGHFKYLSHFVKNRWEPATVVEHVRLLDELDIPYKELQQFLGKEGTTLQQMPKAFASERLHQKFKATYLPTGDWNIEGLVRAGEPAPAETA